MIDGGNYLIPGAWSPDGTKLTFSVDPGTSADIHILHGIAETFDDTSITVVTTSGTANAHVVWSPDSKRLAYQGGPGGGNIYEIHVVNVDGSRDTAITNNPYTDQTASWGEAFRHVGQAAVGESVERSITIRNDGTGTLNVTGIHTADNAFNETPSMLTIAPGGSDSFAIEFNATVTGTVYDTLFIESNDPQSPTVKLLINGTGIVPPNRPPVADAGPDQTGDDAVECAGTLTEVLLDGSGFTDPDDDDLTYTWSGPFGAVTAARADTIVKLPAGTHTITGAAYSVISGTVLILQALPDIGAVGPGLALVYLGLLWAAVLYYFLLMPSEAHLETIAAESGHGEIAADSADATLFGLTFVVALASCAFLALAFAAK